MSFPAPSCCINWFSIIRWQRIWWNWPRCTLLWTHVLLDPCKWCVCNSEPFFSLFPLFICAEKSKLRYLSSWARTTPRYCLFNREDTGVLLCRSHVSLDRHGIAINAQGKSIDKNRPCPALRALNCLSLYSLLISSSLFIQSNPTPFLRTTAVRSRCRLRGADIHRRAPAASGHSTDGQRYPCSSDSSRR